MTCNSLRLGCHDQGGGPNQNITMNEESKPKSIFESKTIVVNAVAAATVFYPPVGALVSANPEIAVGFIALLNLVLRFITRQKVTLFPEG